MRINYSHPDSKQHLTKQMQLCSDNSLYLGPALIDRSALAGLESQQTARCTWCVSGFYCCTALLRPLLARPSLLIIRSSANEWDLGPGHHPLLSTRNPLDTRWEGNVRMLKRFDVKWRAPPSDHTHLPHCPTQERPRPPRPPSKDHRPLNFQFIVQTWVIMCYPLIAYV